MIKISSRMALAISKAQAWEKLQDITLPHNYVPGIVKTEIITTEKTGVGACRLVYSSEQKALSETVIQWNEGSGFVLRVHQAEKGAPAPFKELNFEYSLEEIDGESYLHNSMIYIPAWGRLGLVLNNLILKKIITGSLRDVTLAQKLFYESGEPTSAVKLKLKKSKVFTQ